MEYKENADELIQEVITKIIRQDTNRSLQQGEVDKYSTSRKLVLLHLLTQLYEYETPKQTAKTLDPMNMESLVQQIDALQQKTDDFIQEMNQTRDIE